MFVNTDNLSMHKGKWQCVVLVPVDSRDGEELLAVLPHVANNLADRQAHPRTAPPAALLLALLMVVVVVSRHAFTTRADERCNTHSHTRSHAHTPSQKFKSPHDAKERRCRRAKKAVG